MKVHVAIKGRRARVCTTAKDMADVIGEKPATLRAAIRRAESFPIMRNGWMVWRVEFKRSSNKD